MRISGVVVKLAIKLNLMIHSVIRHCQGRTDLNCQMIRNWFCAQLSLKFRTPRLAYWRRQRSWTVCSRRGHLSKRLNHENKLECLQEQLLKCASPFCSCCQLIRNAKQFVDCAHDRRVLVLRRWCGACVCLGWLCFRSDQLVHEPQSLS